MNSKQSLQTNSIYKLMGMGMKANLDWLMEIPLGGANVVTQFLQRINLQS